MRKHNPFYSSKILENKLLKCKESNKKTDILMVITSKIRLGMYMSGVSIKIYYFVLLWLYLNFFFFGG